MIAAVRHVADTIRLVENIKGKNMETRVSALRAALNDQETLLSSAVDEDRVAVKSSRHILTSELHELECGMEQPTPTTSKIFQEDKDLTPIETESENKMERQSKVINLRGLGVPVLNTGTYT